MQCLFAVFFFLQLSLSHRFVLADTVRFLNIQDDLNEFNKTCKRESCENIYEQAFPYLNCDCGIQCVRLGTCCIDSPYAQIRQPKLKPTCRQVYQGTYEYYFIVDECPFIDSVWASSCNSEWDDDDDGDMLKIVPVTSLMSSITYKNYYCFRCHETTEDFMYWNVMLQSLYMKYNASESEIKDEHISINYDNINGTWMASYDKSKNWNAATFLPVKLNLILPGEIRSLAHACEPNVISDCSVKWTDEEINEKCHSYMALREVRKSEAILKYKNVHCALCNFESLDTIFCKTRVPAVAASPPAAAPGSGKVPFSFTYLLDINRSDGELVGKIQKCSEDHLWDPYAKKCRKLTCALPGYKIKSGKCIPE